MKPSHTETRIIDSHSHLGWESLAGELDAVLERAAEAGIVAVVDVGIDVESSRAALERARSRRRAVRLHPTVGIHPNDCAGFAESWPEIAELARSEEVVAIGETGLDLYRDRVPLDVQLRSLEHHLDLARELNKPVILHCRDAFAELLDALSPHGRLHGVLHCFTGGPVEAERCVDLGLHVSFAGPISYPKNHELRKAATVVPARCLLVETDAPFLPPQEYRGKRNEPSYVVHTLHALAEARNEPLGEVASACLENTAHLFGLGSEEVS